jgi:hypothetical protein
VNPIVIYTDQNAINAQDINFPSLSFCPGIIFETMRVPFKYLKIREKLENQTLSLNSLTSYELKMMQVISLVADDRFMSENYPNISISTDNFMDVLNSTGSFVGDPLSKFYEIPYFYFRGNFSNKYAMNLTRTLWKTGFCHTFNFPNSSQMFYMEGTSQDFNFTQVSMHGTEGQWHPEYKLKLNYPVKPENLKKSLYVGYTEGNLKRLDDVVV